MIGKLLLQLVYDKENVFEASISSGLGLIYTGDGITYKDFTFGPDYIAVVVYRLDRVIALIELDRNIVRSIHTFSKNNSLDVYVITENCKESVDEAITLGEMLEQNVCTVADKFNVHCKLLSDIQVTSLYTYLQDYNKNKNADINYSWILNKV